EKWISPDGRNRTGLRLANANGPPGVRANVGYGAGGEAKKALQIPQHDRVRKNHARNRSSASGHVQLFVAGAEGAAGPSTAGSAGHDGRDSGSNVAAVRCHVCGARSALDCAGEVAAVAVVADALLGAQRA